MKPLTEKQMAGADEALLHASMNQSFINYPTIINGFVARGIPAENITPRENVFTFKAWLALGRVVRKGEHGIKILTYITTERGKNKSDGTKEIKVSKRPWTSTVFHITQTDPIG